jgi:hypothetical protein
MRIPRDFLFFLGAVLLLSLDSRAQTPAQPGEPPAQPANAPETSVTVPSKDMTAAQPGCWAKLYDAENFGGQSLTLVGPTEVPKLEGTFVSLEVGPSAVVQTFQDDHFGKQSKSFQAGERIKNLQGSGGDAQLKSIKVSCTTKAAK